MHLEPIDWIIVAASLLLCFGPSLFFGKRAGKFAAEFAKEHGAGKINADQVESVARWTLQPFDRAASSGSTASSEEGPYRVQHDLQEKMQDLVGIVRNEEEMLRALDEVASLRKRAQQVAVDGNREYNTGWHTALDLANLLIVSEAITRAAIERKESRGGHFREDFPDKVKSFGELNIIVRRGPGGEMQVAREKIPDMPAELKQVIEEQK